VFQQAPARRIEEPPRRTDLLSEETIRFDFRPGVPALDLFPRKAWKTALGRGLRQANHDELGYGPVEGLPRLRRLIAEYVARTRGLPVVPERVVITVGAAQALDLVLRTLAPIQHMAVENPGSEPVRRLADLHHIQTHAIPVDEAGMQVDRLNSEKNVPRLVHVVPSHQYPSGWAMSLERRMDLLNWAEQAQAVILEDDYDSEFRFDRLPPLALAALDSAQRVVYLGTFSKTLFPGLRLGFCILPERLVDPLLNLKWFSDRCVPVIEQLALADWLESGLFERHIRKMRDLYAQRRDDLTHTLEKCFGTAVQVWGVPAGMHLCARFDLGWSEAELIKRAVKAGVKVYPASICYVGESPNPPALILGFGNLSSAALTSAVERLAAAWKR
jgi:GntR family transcriptional regulator/MocR family aminotransferase